VFRTADHSAGQIRNYVSAVRKTAAIEVPFIASAAGMELIHSTIEQIYSYMERTTALQTPEIVLAYCRFFFTVVVGQLGAFRLVDSVDQLPWLENVTEADKQQIVPHLTSLRYIGDNERHELRGTILFKNAEE
jgi:hypothetical protein